jgi:hypothetical protein
MAVVLFRCYYIDLSLVIQSLLQVLLNILPVLGYHQRVLEHCDDENTLSVMMEEIMKSVVTLTEDQYGNYVIQVT